MKKQLPVSGIMRHVSVDTVLFGYNEGHLKVLLCRLPTESGGTEWKLPGHLIRKDETVEAAAVRILHEQTGMMNIFLKQFHVFSSLDRLHRREFDLRWAREHGGSGEWRVVTVGFYALVDYAGTDLSELSPGAEWRDMSDIGEMMFDHREILEAAFEKMRSDVNFEPVVFELLHDRFTLTELQNLYELIVGRPVDKRNFRRRAISKPYIVPLAESQKGVAHRAAGYYMFNRKIFDKSRETSDDPLSL